MSDENTSATAYGVVCSLYQLARLPRWRKYFSEESAYLNAALARLGRDTLAKRAIYRLSPKMFIRISDFLFIPGMVQHYLFRKLLIERQLKEIVEDGTRQVIVLGAGLDTLALRMAAAHPQARFFEIDLPPTQTAKRGMLEKIGYSIPTNCAFMPADLAHTRLETVLRGHPAFDAGADTLVILEGVLMYLSEAEVRALFTGLSELLTGKLRIIFGAMATLANDDNWRVRLFNAFLLGGKEKIKWHCRDVAAFVRPLGYALKEAVSYKTLQSIYRSEKELRGVPENDENYYLIEKVTPHP